MIFGLLLAATVAKLASSGDDVVWLLPFIAGQRRRRKFINAALYLLTLECVVVLSALGARAGSGMLMLLIPSGSLWSPESLLSLVAGIFLALYAAWLFWRSRRHQSDTDIKRSGSSVVLISFLGSMDELATFTPLIVGGAFTPWVLAGGTLIAGLIVIGICLGAAMLRPVVDVLKRIPLWVIIGAFAMLTLAGAL